MDVIYLEEKNRRIMWKNWTGLERDNVGAYYTLPPAEGDDIPQQCKECGDKKEEGKMYLMSTVFPEREDQYNNDTINPVCDACASGRKLAEDM